MNQVIVSKLALAAALLLAPSMTVAAQDAVTVSGHVSAAGAPVAGAHVRIVALKIDRTTDADGYYSFIISSSIVRGQTVRMQVTMTDRRVRYAPASADLTLTGVPVNQDFDLKITSGERPSTPDAELPAAGRGGKPGVPAAGATSANMDTLNFGELAGAVDLTSALAGRVPGLAITTPGVLGGSPLAVYRGPRSILGSSQPLIVVNGVQVDNTTFASQAQRYGLGGFDYGSPVQDLDLSTVASVRFMAGPEAARRFGGVAANGVIVVTTKDGSDAPGFAISAGQQITSETPGRLPVFQNQYGQGLDGKFEFFDGKGGGINDAVDQNWGPALDGRPVAQASLTEVGRGDVRLWTASPSSTTDYFAAGKTLNSTAAVQGNSDIGSFRVSFGNRDTHGLTPLNTLLRRDGAFRGTMKPSDALSLTAWIAGDQTTNTNAPGTGFNEGNPVAEFTRLGRQVDADSLRVHLVDSNGNQLSWNYAGQNNPYFASLENSNQSERNHVTGGGTVTDVLSPWLTATVQGGTDYYRDARTFNIRSGWMGGFPFFAAPVMGDFSKGGFEGDEIYAQRSNALARLDAVRTLSSGVRWTVGAGGEMRTLRDRIRSAGLDSAADLPVLGAPDTASIPQPQSWNAHSRTNALFGETGVVFSNGAAIHGGLRNEWAALVPGQHTSTIYPSIDASMDLLRAFSAHREDRALTGATVRAGWSSSSSDVGPYGIESMYAGRTPSGSLAPLGNGLIIPDTSLAPEITNAWQLGADLAFGRRADASATIYHEQTTGVILPVADNALGTVTAQNAGTITNSGIEGQVTARFGDGDNWLGWEISGNAARNSNSVDRLNGSATSIAIAPSQFGLTVQARAGQPLGVLAGDKFLRDPTTHSLILRNGLPLPDTIAGPQQLGVAQPNWILGLSNTFRFRWLSLRVQADGHLGGSIFSATNLMGDYAGSLAETAFRPDSGLLIAGLDATTGKANTQHVSAQDYFHALAAIQEPWVYSASYIKVRDVRFTLAVPPALLGSLPFSGINVSVIARNVYLWAKAPNIDPETLLSPYQFSGIEMGQLPATKSVGFQVSITP